MVASSFLKSEGECRGQIKILGPVPVGLYRQSLSFGGTQAIAPVVLYRQSLSFGRTQAIAHTRKQSASLICASALVSLFLCVSC